MAKTYKDYSIHERINIKTHLTMFLFPLEQALIIGEGVRWFSPSRPAKCSPCSSWAHEQFKSGKKMSDYQ